MNRKVSYPIVVVLLLVSFLSAAIVFGQDPDPGQPDIPELPGGSDGLEGDGASNLVGGGDGQTADVTGGDTIDGATAVTGTAITYQGRLTDGGSPANGAFEFTFALHDEPVIDSQVGITLSQLVTITEGLFMADLDFGNVFDGTAMYLQIGVRPDGSADPYEMLTPRQPLRPAPYAISLRPGADVVGPAGFNSVIEAHNTATSGSSSYGLRGETDSTSSYAAGVYGRVTATSPGGFSAGVRGVNEGTGGNGIGVYGSHNGNGWGVYGTSVDGYGGYFISSGPNGRGIYARSGDGALPDIILGSNSSSNAGDDGRISSNPGLSDSDLYLTSNDAVVVELDNDASGGDADFFVQDMNDTTIFNIDESGEMSLFTPGGVEYFQTNEDTTEGGGEIVLRNASGTTAMWVEASEGGTDGAQLALYNAAGTATILLDAEFGAGGDGRITTEVLQITGGSDLSEQFEIQAGLSGQQPQAGYVVAIDLDNPGELVVSSRAYDRTVAGVVSGAGGVKPGMLMGQAGTAANGRYPVALTGRVYVWVDASYGAVQPGDLLTTSNTPGHAMLVGDHAEAQGAILGKAMTALTDGRGLVLVLVTLQ